MKISVITINFNNCAGLQKTIESVVAQTYIDYEWIVVDGGSTDGSRELIEEYTNRFSYWVSEPDKGVYNAMNKGIKVAQGDYVIFMNSGDCFADSNVLQNVVGELDCDIVAGWVKEDKSGVISKPPEDFTLWPLFLQNIPHQAEFIRTRLFHEIAMYAEDLKVIADLEFNVRVALHDCTYRTINKIVAIVEPGGISSTEMALMEAEGAIIRERNLPSSVRKDYVNWIKKEKALSSPSVVWAMNEVWPLKVLRVMKKLFGK